jgi:hypothetical protein
MYYICPINHLKLNTMAKQIDFSEVTLREQISSRGGGIEIDLTRFGFKGEKMNAYQNYLGGGMLGRIQANDTIRAFNKPFITEKQAAKLDKIAERLKQYFHNLTNPDTEWEGQSYIQNQRMPSSAY